MYNALYFVPKQYRVEQNREIGMHYLQYLLDHLHKKSWWKSQGTLKSHLEAPNKEVLEKLRLKYPKPEKPAGKGNGQLTRVRKTAFTKGDGGKPGGKPGGRPTGKGPWTPNKKPYWGGNRNNERSRSRERKGKTQDGGGKPTGKTQDGGKKGKSQNDVRVQKAFSLAKQGGRICGHYQCGTCTFGRDCQKDHVCYICKNPSHGAYRCFDLYNANGTKRLGL